ncbi:phosphoribosylformylglycinamidine cyclo-ligase [Patescibacteria group bacterium]|nr:phosphoribosylformylglycinamidine cyclo-ligase [Patescibacteria group bacterium]
MPLTYASSGVQYHSLDRLKRLAQVAAAKTGAQLTTAGMEEVGTSRGESAYVWKTGATYSSLVIEGLGTKNLVADQVRPLTGKTYYDQIAQDTVAMIVNDLIVVGAKPLVINAYFAVGSSQWFDDAERTDDLVNGWEYACELAGITWGGGETPTLKQVIEPTAIDLAGSCVGIIDPADRLTLGDKLQTGDVILLIESSGIHANGITLARAIADTVPQGYGTKLDTGQTYGESLLRPTHIYARLVQELFEAEIDIHYMVNITGHGWRKLMRAPQAFTYRLIELPPVDPLFDFIQTQSGNDDAEMYGNFNMGAGFAIYLPAGQVEQARRIAEMNYHLRSWPAGTVETGPKQVIIEPKAVTFGGETLAVR